MFCLKNEKTNERTSCVLFPACDDFAIRIEKRKEKNEILEKKLLMQTQDTVLSDKTEHNM